LDYDGNDVGTPTPVVLSNDARLVTHHVGGTFSIASTGKTCEIIGITHGE
jgi:hypothetical protein